MIVQLCKLKTIELCTLNRFTLWYVNYISRKLYKKEEGDRVGGGGREEEQGENFKATEDSFLMPG